MTTLKIANDENNIAEIYFSGNNTSQGQGVDFLLPSSDDKFQNFNDKDTDKLIAAAPNPNPKESGADYFMKYDSEGKLSWSELRSTLSEYEDKGKITSDNIDFPTAIQTYSLTNTKPKFTNKDLKIHLESLLTNNIIPEWISLHACVSDIGLKQLTWNTNEEYVKYNSTETGNLKLGIPNTIDNNFNFKINYINEDSNYLETETDINSKNLKNARIVSFEIDSQISGNSTNMGPIELYYEVDTDGDSDLLVDGGLGTLKMYFISGEEDNCFNYNCQYQNCQYENCYYTNQYYNKGLDFLREQSISSSLDQYIYVNKPDDTPEEGDITSSEMYDLIEKAFEKEYGDFQLFLNNFGNGDSVDLELEGGFGRKGVIRINKDKSFKIVNSGYLYQVNDTLRFKDYRLRDLVFFKLNETDDSNETVTSRYLQEFISPGASKSNTIKYAIGQREAFLIKNLTITGSTESNVVVRLNHISDCFSNNPIQKVLKEFYYYKRNNINESHDLNILIENDIISGGKIHEFYLDIQKIVKGSNDKNKMDTLSFTLNGIKYVKAIEAES